MVKIAAAQIAVTNNSKQNFNKIIQYLKKASLEKVKIVCFPETALIHNKNKKAIKNIDFKYYLKQIKKACKENKIHCIFGTNLIGKNKLYNSAFFIDDKGKIIYKYNKKNLWINEKDKVSGKKNNVVKTKFGLIGIIICWDIAFPESVKKLAKKGAWLIFCPSYIKNYAREIDPYLQIPQVRAFENICYFVSCDAYAKDAIRYTNICSPSGIVAEIRNREGLIAANLHKRKIIGLRRHYGLI